MKNPPPITGGFYVSDMAHSGEYYRGSYGADLVL